MSLFGGLYVGASGLKTSSNALNTVAHNLSNVDTKGYTRQQVSQSTNTYNIISKSASAISYQEYGLGVKYSEVRQVRDFFLDKTYRRESGRSAFYEVSYNALTYMEDTLGESGDDSFQSAISDYWKTVQELANDPGSAVTQGLFVSKAATLIERANSVYNSIVSYQNNLNTQIRTQVNQLNKYADQLKFLNNEIAKIETGGIEHANDLRDQRNYILDSMSQIVNISYSEDMDSFVSVQIEGTDFVKRDNVYHMGLDMDENGFYTPFWPQNAKASYNDGGEKVYDIRGAEVYDMTKEISSDKNTDIGALRANLLARGDHFANAEDLTEENDHYNTNIAQSICMNIQAEFDNLISGIVQSVNNILNEAGYTDGSSDLDSALFVRIIPEEGWHVGNIQINSKFLQTPTLLNMKTIDGSVDYETAAKLKDAFDEEAYTLNPNMTKKTSFADYYGDLVSQIGNSGAVYRSIYSNQQETVDSAAYAREQVIGVSSDEELQFMIMYQNAYNASSRYITTINDMLEGLLNAFGA